MVKFSRRALSWPSFWVDTHDKASDFYTTCLQSGDSPVALLVIRAMIAILALLALFWSLYEDHSGSYLVFLTNWGLILLNMMTISALTLSIIAVYNKPQEDEEGHLPWYISLYWLLFNITVSLSILITALYWILLYNPELGGIYPLDLATHAFNSLLVSVEFLLSHTPVKIWHFYQPALVGLWYAAFTAIFYVAGGTVNGFPFIYGILDWRDPTPTSLVVGACFVALLGIYMALWAVAQIRDAATDAIFRSHSMDLPMTASNLTYR